MEDSLFSHSECQMILETEAETLTCQVHEKHLVKGNIPNSSGKEITDICGTANLCPMKPQKKLEIRYLDFPENLHGAPMIDPVLSF